MAGGLLQITTYGTQDLYLTGIPEITFFKVVYRRHTNFSMESLRVTFDDTVGFGLESSLTVPKIGDLIHKTYLEIILPKIDLKRSDVSNDLFLDFNNARNDYRIVLDFMSINREAYVQAADIFVAENTNDPTGMITVINNVFDNANPVTIQNFEDLLNNTDLNPPFLYTEISMQDVVNAVPIGSTKQEYFDALNVALDKSVKTQNFFRLDLVDKQEAHEDEINENIQFAWTDRIGHAIIQQIEIDIGGAKIDRHLGDWINVWYELSANRDMEPTYNKMIGNVSILTNFDRNVKPQYKLLVPLQFWFCRHSGLSIPLVAMQYHDVTFHIKFRKIEDVAYIENNKTIFVSSTKDQLFLNEIPNELDINIEANLLIDYIYLDAQERRRFAQSSHEYLIDQVQVLETKNVTESNFQIVINNFVHPCKELIWLAQQERYMENFSGYIRTRWDNYSISDDNKGNPISFTTLDFHSYNRVARQNGNYFNYVQPYETHHTTPSDGINMYSFCIHPEDHQPSGTANFTRLSRVQLQMEFNPILFTDNTDTVLTVRVYTRNYNILRIMSGMAALSFTYG
jgi:hypothetical protein